MKRSRFSSLITFVAIALFIGPAAESESPTSGKASGEPRRLHRWTSLNWAHPEIPLFSLVGPLDHKTDVSSLAKQIRDKNSALDVYDFREVILADDDKGITIVLNSKERRVLKTLAQKYEGRWFAAVAPPKDFFVGEESVAVAIMTPSMANGRITFKYPECASIAQNLRWRFRIAEFRLTPR